MKQFTVISAGVLLFFLGVVAPAYARQDQHEQDSHGPKQGQQSKPEEQRQAKPEEQKQAKPAKEQQQQPAKAPPEQAKANTHQQQQAKVQQAQAKQNNEQKPAQARTQPTRQPGRQSASSRPPQRTEEAQTRQRAEPDLRLSAMSSSRIPDARFHSSFGRAHSFRIGSPRMVGGYSRFQYGGYWFGFVQPWPADWYYTDAVYIDYIAGQYYLCNPYYPGVHVAITVVM